MENERLLYEHWKKEHQLFERNFNKLRKTITIKYVHDIRVCIKKMKAYRNLFYLLNDEGTKINLTETNKLFNVLGKVRDIHICVNLIAAFEEENNISYPGIRKFLKGKLPQSKTWSREAVKAYDHKELFQFELMLAAVKSTKPESEEFRIRHQIDTTLNDLQSLISQPHRMRQVLKKVYYWIKTLPGKQADQYYKIEKLNAVTDKLGAGQDHEVLLREIRYFRKNFLPKTFEEKKELKKLEKTIKSKKLILIDELPGETDFRK